MKRILKSRCSLLLILFIAVFQPAHSQVSSSCNIPALLASEYKRDIHQLAVKWLFQVQSPDTVLVTIPPALLDSIGGGLAAIFNATSIPERDSVFNLYCVHNLNGWPGNYAGFLLRVDTNYAWTQAWQNLITVTGNAFMDSILTKYSIHISNFYNWSFGSYAELSTDSSWNVFALMDSMKMTPGVLSAELNGIIGAAGVIDFNMAGGDRYYDFYFEFNDCFDGCDNYHKWSFKVFPDCSVLYLGFDDWGFFGVSPLPPPVNCNTFTGMEENVHDISFNVFPNPAQDKINISTGKDRSVPFDFILYDLTGRAMTTVNSNGRNTTTVEVGSLPAGAYIYSWYIEGKYAGSGKLIRQ